MVKQVFWATPRFRRLGPVIKNIAIYYETDKEKYLGRNIIII